MYSKTRHNIIQYIGWLWDKMENCNDYNERANMYNMYLALNEFHDASFTTANGVFLYTYTEDDVNKLLDSIEMYCPNSDVVGEYTCLNNIDGINNNCRKCWINVLKI